MTESTDISLDSPRSSVIRQIEDAFKSFRPPSIDKLVENADTDITAHEAWCALKGKSWQQLRDELSPLEYRELCAYRSALFFVTPEAFAYYLPSILIRTIYLDEEVGSLLDTLLFILSGDRVNSDSLAEDMQNVKLLMSSDQKAALIAFLEYVKQHGSDIEEDAQRAVDFWSS